jgi:hypothetical protein
MWISAITGLCWILLLIGGVKLEITSKCAAWIRVFWGVSIKDIYPVIYSEWSEFCKAFSGNAFLQDVALRSNEHLLYPFLRIQLLFCHYKTPRIVGNFGSEYSEDLMFYT